MHAGRDLSTQQTQSEANASSQRTISRNIFDKFLFHSIFGKTSVNPQKSACQLQSESLDQSFVEPLNNHTTDRNDEQRGRPVGVGLPRQTTFKRQISEQRQKLCPVSTSDSRRTLSVSGYVPSGQAEQHDNLIPVSITTQKAHSISDIVQTSDVAVDNHQASSRCQYPPFSVFDTQLAPQLATTRDASSCRSPRPASRASSCSLVDKDTVGFIDRAQLNAELDSKWILNLSMHFRDKSDREKFFVTYAETDRKWRRVTVSVDYRDAEYGSLEMDLRGLTVQRDKSLQIYEAIRDSLQDIQFYDTVTNLKLETADGRLHVHVTEDINEIISYPSFRSIEHLLNFRPSKRPRIVYEDEVIFDSHVSGFVYKVWYEDRLYIKKEIPSPDTVDEFLYEANALHALTDSPHVIQLEAIIIDERKNIVKGLLLSFADKGALVDLLYDNPGETSWERREKWAHQIIAGIRDIHEEGYVQGDCTLSNVVIDQNDNARIIDINRRGCPVGWEPPEIAAKIPGGSRISMYIGEKSDLYQLGMCLWGLAMNDDEPERHPQPLGTARFPADVPDYFGHIIRICLSARPRDRLAAKDLMQIIAQYQIHNSPYHSLVDEQTRFTLQPEDEHLGLDNKPSRHETDEHENVESALSARSRDQTLVGRSYDEYNEYRSSSEESRGRKLHPDWVDQSELMTTHTRAPKYTRSERPSHQMQSDSTHVAADSNILEPPEERVLHLRSSDQTLTSEGLRLATDKSEGLDGVRSSVLPESGMLSDQLRISSWQRSVSENTPRASLSNLVFPSDRTASPSSSPRSHSLGALDYRANLERMSAKEYRNKLQSQNTHQKSQSTTDRTELSGSTCGPDTSFDGGSTCQSDTEYMLLHPYDESLYVPKPQHKPDHLNMTTNAAALAIPKLALFDSGFDEPTIQQIENNQA